MKRSECSEAQIVYTIRQAEVGIPVGDFCRQLEEENSRLNRLVADRSFNKHMRPEALRKKVCSPPAAENGLAGLRTPFRSVACGPVVWRSSVGRPGSRPFPTSVGHSAVLGVADFLQNIALCSP